jgi:hypothetical protein
VSCPGSIAALQQCQNDTSWYDNVDWTVKMSAYFRYASVAYSRSNGTIIWQSFTDTPAIPLNMTPAQILLAYDTLLLDTSTFFAKNTSAPPAAAFSSSTFAAYLWMSEPVFSGQNATNPATINGVFSSLQSLLAIPLYLCQNGIARRLLPLAVGAKSVQDQNTPSAGGSPGFGDLVSMLSPLPERTSTPTLIAYIVLSGVAILCCAAAHLLVRFTVTLPESGGDRWRRRVMPELSRFPALDLFAHCTIEDENRYVVYQGRSGTFHYDAAQKSQMEWLATLRVRYSGGAVAAEDGLRLFTFERGAGSSSKGDSGAEERVSYMGSRGSL